MHAGYRNRSSGSLSSVGYNSHWWSYAPSSQASSRNLNFNSSNVNPLYNTRAHGFAVLPAQEFEFILLGIFIMTYNDLYYYTTRAYLDARKNERNTSAQIDFELNLESNIRDLVDSLYYKSWKPAPLYWFIMIDPTLREVFSPIFRDRIVSHILFNFLYPVFDNTFIYDSYSCRKEKGTLFGIDRFEHHIRSVTNNYTLPGYCLNIDISGYFMSIDRNILYNIIIDTLYKKEFNIKYFDFVEYLISSYLFRDPLENSKFIGNPNYIKLMPENKSLRFCKPGVGLPIGDVTNQLNSNIYMNLFDYFVLRKLHIKHYGRYVDDSRLLYNDYKYLEECKIASDEFLTNVLHLTMDPNKTTITDLYDTNYFLGAAFKPYRKYVTNKTIKRTKKYFKYLNDEIINDPYFNKEYELSHLNSRLGYFSHFNEYKFLKREIEKYPSLINIYEFDTNLSKAKIIQ